MEEEFEENKTQRHKNDSITLSLSPHSISYGATNSIPINNSSSSICNLTSEAFPSVYNYKNDYSNGKRRPSLAELHEHGIDQQTIREHIDMSDHIEEHVGFKLGWIQGVLIPCLLNIWGVMLFLRMPWVVAQAGIFGALVIVLVSTFVCMLTTLSLSALCTNGEVKGGGIYFIISRSLGPEFGASVGVVLAFANAVSASLNTIGFCDSLNDLLFKYYDYKMFENNMDSVRVIGVVAILVMIFICASGIEWESKAQNFLIAIIVLAMADFFIGTIIGPTSNPEKIAKGFVGFSWNLISENWNAGYTFTEGVQYSFFSVFAIFFPSVTGIQAGANISGDLKDPSSAIPKGTLLSLFISMISYAGTIIFSGAAAVRRANGNVSEVSGQIMPSSDGCEYQNCMYGLYRDYSIMQLMSTWSFVIYAGCFAATLSTALTNLLTVPRLLQALGADEIYPGLLYFAKQYGKSREPYRGYIITFFLSALFVLIAKLNAIAPLITNFYLASYALINFCTFHAALIEPLGWRPTFKYYNMWLSLFGCLLCLIIMFLIDWVTSLATFVIFFMLYLLVVYRQPDVNWGSSTQAQIYKSALSSSHRLTNVSDHVKNYQPQILLLIGEPHDRPTLLELAHLITKNNALLLCAYILKDKLSYKQRSEILYAHDNILNERKVKAFNCIIDGLKFEDAAKGLMQCCGIGKLRPNILMMGYKNNWTASSSDELQAYFNVLHNAFDNCFGVAILRMPGGLDVSEFNVGFGGKDNATFAISSEDIPVYVVSNENLSGDGLSNMPKESPLPSKRRYNVGFEEKRRKKNIKTHSRILDKCSNVTDIQLHRLTMFSSKQKSGTIDVWWLYDDGGLTILLPYILNSRSIFDNCQLRIFAIANDQQQLALEEKNMAQLLKKFRIKYSSLKMISDVSIPRYEDNEILFNDLLKRFVTDPESGSFVNDRELNDLKHKTNRQLRLKELLTEYSKTANLVIMSLPMPRKGVVPAAIYMAWLEVLTCNMPPFLLVRGNQRSVLTFYS